MFVKKRLSEKRMLLEFKVLSLEVKDIVDRQIVKSRCVIKIGIADWIIFNFRRFQDS